MKNGKKEGNSKKQTTWVGFVKQCVHINAVCCLTCLSSFCCIRLELSSSMPLQRKSRNLINRDPAASAQDWISLCSLIQGNKDLKKALKTSNDSFSDSSSWRVCKGGKEPKRIKGTKLQLRECLTGWVLEAFTHDTYLKGPSPCCLATIREKGKSRSPYCQSQSQKPAVLCVGQTPFLILSTFPAGYIWKDLFLRRMKGMDQKPFNQAPSADTHCHILSFCVMRHSFEDLEPLVG